MTKQDAMRAAVEAPETQSPPEGGEGLASQKATPKGCPCKHSDCATLREALQQIADMDANGLRADDLGRAALLARSALLRSALEEGEPAELFDGHAVYHALSPRARLRTSPENVSDVLDALVHVMRSPTADKDAK